MAAAAAAAAATLAGSAGAGGSVAALNPLSVPRGGRLGDGLTGGPAKFVATLEGGTYYYATLESQKLDYEGVLHRIAPAMAELSTILGTVGTSVERAGNAKRTRALQTEVAGVCKAVAQHLLAAKSFELAIPSALRGLRTLIALHGDGAVELVPAYLVLAEVNLGLGRVAQSEGFLSTANYILVKHPGASNELRSRMHRNFGRVYAAQGNNAAALASFTRDIYFAAMALGPEHTTASIGYFFLAQVFAAQGDMEAALALFDKVVDIWYKQLLHAKSAIAAALGIDFAASPPEARLAAAAAVAAAAAASSEPSSKAAGATTRLGATTSATSLSATSSAPPPSPSAAATAAAAPADAGDAAGGSHQLTEMQVVEGLEMLDFICKVRETQLGADHIATAECKYTRAPVFVDGCRYSEAVPYVEAALGTFTAALGEGHTTTQELARLLEHIKTLPDGVEA